MTEPAKRRGNPSWRKGGPSPNPSGKRGDSAQVQERADGWMNLLNGMGVLGVDKSMSGGFGQVCTDVVSYETCRSLWRFDDIGARIVESWPNNELREGFELCIADDRALVKENPDEYAQDHEVASRQVRRHLDRRDAKRRTRLDAAAQRGKGGKTLAEKVASKWKDLGLLKAMWTARAYERAYGGGAILIGARDGRKLSEPLDMANVQSVDFLTPLEPREITPWEYYADPNAAKFGEVATYQLNLLSVGQAYTPNGITAPPVAYEVIHESRLIVFGGIRVSRQQVSTAFGSSYGFGDSIFNRIFGVLGSFHMSWRAVSILINDFSQAIFKIKGLAEMVAADKADQFKTRMQIVELSRSIARAIMLDADGEEFERKSTNVTGLPELLDKICSRLAAAADMPLTLLMGMSPGGLNATGDSDVRFYYDRIASSQVQDVVPRMEYLTRIIMATMGGEPEHWSIEPRPLWQPSDKEQAETRLVHATTDEKNIANGIYTGQEARDSRYGGDKYSSEIHIDDSQPDEPPATPEEAATLRQPDPNAPVADPNAFPPAPGAPPESGPLMAQPAPAAAAPIEPAKQGMNGAQITSLIEVVKAVGAKEIARESAAAILELAFAQVTPELAQRILGPVDFEPVEPPAPPSPFGGPPAPPDGPTPAKPDEPPPPPETSA